MSTEMSQTSATLPAGRIHMAVGPELSDIGTRALMLRLLEAQERHIRAQRAALDAYAREVGQLLAVLRQE